MQRASWCQCWEDVLTPRLEGTCYERLFVPCPSRFTGKATWCPWLVPVCAGVMQESHPPSLLGILEDACLFTPVLGGCVTPVGLAGVWEQ